MRLATEKVLREIQEYLDETSELPWGTAHVILMQAQELIESQRRQLRHLEKMVVWAEDITMHGTRSEEYEDGFWDAVDFVREKQNG
jgi:squalene cyclase